MSGERAVVVGGGVLGTMHALEACRRGWEVVHLEADAGPRRASVRNFGLIWVGGRAGGSELELALRARERWEELGEQAPAVGFRPDGSITIATDESELALMAEAAGRADAPARGIDLLDATDVRSVNPTVEGAVVGGLWCRKDAVVEPGSVLGALRDLLDASGRYRWLPCRRVVGTVAGADTAGGGTAGGGTAGGGTDGGDGVVVVDHLGERHHGSLAILCIGDQLSGIGGSVGAALTHAPLRRCRLHMMQTSPAPQRLTTAIADADSMRYYPAFDLPGRAGLPAPRPETLEWGMQLLVVQRGDGALTIGDTHTYDEPFDFALDETVYDRLRDRTEQLLGWQLPPVVRRWAGTYSLLGEPGDGAACYRSQIEPGVWVVTAPAGRGMTLSPALAEQTWQELAG